MVISKGVDLVEFSDRSAQTSMSSNRVEDEKYNDDIGKVYSDKNCDDHLDVHEHTDCPRDTDKGE